MTIDVRSPDRIPMSQKERDVLFSLRGVLAGKRTQAEAADLLQLSVRHAHRIERRLEASGDGAIATASAAGPPTAGPMPHTRIASWACVASITQTSARASPARSCSSRTARRSARKRPATGRSRRACGSAGGVGIRTAPAGPCGTASVGWSRWTPPFTTGWRAGRGGWCRLP